MLVMIDRGVERGLYFVGFCFIWLVGIDQDLMLYEQVECEFQGELGGLFLFFKIFGM